MIPSLFVHQEGPLTISIYDSKGQCHSHPLWYSLLDVLSHEVIIGLVDLIGPYYDFVIYCAISVHTCVRALRLVRYMACRP